eukprot:CAMPEP_0194271056 /NCGR_PEP_ID=MMETSP0169-20130528/4941_1 /TAXON_ID=218684 /ORGANISM="Corethron pennatum, Strain L29A3" /LENGTH=32 /DNA_ID= /DNA_START= /DNA_END= /DNA_ORIENTATION=
MISAGERDSDALQCTITADPDRSVAWISSDTE